METNPRECMFCHGDLPVRPDEPVNLAFMAHIDNQQACKEGFDVWADNMQRDFTGY